MLTFREVARSGSFSEAARALSLSQPAVSQQVAALEREVGLRLMARGPGGLTLTEAGSLMLDHADAVAGRIDLADMQLSELAAAEQSTLRLGASPSALATFVPRAVERLLAARDALEVGIVEGTVDGLAGSVATGELHAAVAFQNADDPRREFEATARTDLFRERFMALLPPSHRLASRKRIRLHELADDIWTVPSREGIVGRSCREALRAARRLPVDRPTRDQRPGGARPRRDPHPHQPGGRPARGEGAPGHRRDRSPGRIRPRSGYRRPPARAGLPGGAEARARPSIGGVRRLFLLVCAVVFVDTAFYAAIAPLLPSYAADLGLSKTAAGVLTASYAAGTLMGSLPAGWLASRFGVKPTLLHRASG